MPEERLRRLAASMAEFGAVDWNEAERNAQDDEERRTVRRLRDLAHIAQVHSHDHLVNGASPARAGAAAEVLGVRTRVESPFRGERWGRLQLRSQIGAGAFGEVFRAWDDDLEREVALKLVPVRESATGEATTPTGAAEFLREARLLARVRHPNVITVYGVDLQADRVGLWMELVEGRNLERLVLEQGSLGAREAALVGLDLCRALTAIHRVGLVHRDVKAQNVVREQGGRIVLMDFGAARELERTTLRPAMQLLTGTPFYTAPEILNGERATEQSDVYSLGVLLYYLVSGSYPVEAEGLEQLLAAHARGETRFLRQVRPDLPEPFVHVVEKALAHEPSHRFASAAHLERALSAALGAGEQPRPAPDRRPYRVLLPVLAVLLLAGWLGRWAWQSTGRSRERSTQTPGMATSHSEEGRPTGATYSVEATFHRVEAGGKEPLLPGSMVRRGDGLALQIRASTALYVYVVNEDERGEAYLLFPHPDLVPVNPLSPNVTHVLPGRLRGVETSWEVTSTGEREHFLVVASPERLMEFEAEVSVLPRPEEVHAAPYPPLPESAMERLRGVGGFRTEPPREHAPSGRLSSLVAKLAVRPETVQGIWVRQIEFENPAP